MNLRDVNKTLGKIDYTLTNIIPIAEGVVNKVRNSVGSWGFEGILNTPIDDYCLIDMADWQLRKNMFLNIVEKNVTLDILGDSVTGITNRISGETYDYRYTYTEGNNYLDYQNVAKLSTTREGYTSNNVQNYVDHNQLYSNTTNLYPDEDNSGTDKFSNNKKWMYYEGNNNRNSIIYKTKKLFDDRKINTIISRFHTDPDRLDLYSNTEAKSDYGLSHGRNLLTYDAERNGISYNRNGYDNPYCRVWTHHHQYSESRSRLIRPFSVEDENGNDVVKTNQAFHNWANFKDVEYKVRDRYSKVEVEEDKEFGESYSFTQYPEKYEKWSWKDSGKDGWAKSVLNRDTGLVNITPKFLGGAEKNIHTKDCMFSIENLAWQGYDPYSFERALSWEQRGPFGGRIMWFPPYGLRFSEESSVNWNEHSFIGRGENVYTYTNTTRSGTLEFMMVVDHPSILDYSTWFGESQPDKLPKDTDVLRFFAGCDGGSADNNFSNGEYNGGSGNQGLSSYARPTPLTDEYLEKDPIEKKKALENPKPKPQPESPVEQDPPPTDSEEIITFYVFFPNNYSGAFDNNEQSKVNPIAYLLCGKGTQWRCDTNNVVKSQPLPLYFDYLSGNDSDSIGEGYEMKNSKTQKATQDSEKNYIIGTQPNWRYYKSSKYVPYTNKKWYYRIDGEYKVASGEGQYKNTFDQTLRTTNSYRDMQTLGLNYDIEAVRNQFQEEKDNKNLYTLAEIAYALKNNYHEGVDSNETEDQIFINSKAGSSISKSDERIKRLIEFFDPRESSIYKVIELHGVGYSNSHGSNAVKEINVKRNIFLAEQRCKTVINWFQKYYGNNRTSINSGSEVSEPGVAVDKQDSQNESGRSAKKWRSAKITIKVKKSAVVEPKNLNQTDNLAYLSVEEYNALSSDEKQKCSISLYERINDDKTYPQTLTKEAYDKLVGQHSYVAAFYRISQYSKPKEVEDIKPEEVVYNRFIGFQEVEIDAKTNTQLYVNVNETDPSKKEDRWYYNESTKEMIKWNTEVERTRRSSYGWTSEYGNDYKKTNEYNSLRYDQEYHFFKQLKTRDPHVFDSLVKKLQYFDPAFHSMTPEGFMGRLNFLHQCTRQGNTISASDEDGHSANNLAFGRPPFCILRLGDFYYQKIVIRNISINYDPLVLDLNNEGIGVVPLIANVTISFNFIGGGDLSGPVRRLQNAMSSNYYANGRLYDNRADRVERESTNWETMGAMGNDKINFEDSYFHEVKMSK